MQLLNANDFDHLINLFLDDGALQPPFQRPIVGREAILKFLVNFTDENNDGTISKL